MQSTPETTRNANALTRHNRERLMRSTRKLGAVLGTTPLVVEPVEIVDVPDEPEDHDRSLSLTRSRSLSSARRKSSRPGPPPRRRSSVSTHRSSCSSFEVVSVYEKPPPLPSPSKLTKASANAPPRQLTLFLNTALANTASDQTSLRPPRSPSFISICSTAPPSPTLSVIAPPPDVIRRRKMAKLKRTLGENVPVELVFRAEPDPPPRRTTTTTTNPRPNPPTTTNLQSIAPSTSASTAPTSFRPPPSSSFPSFPFGRRRPGSGAPFLERHLRKSDEPRAPDWTGEWNVRDIREVQQGLRALKKA